VSGYTSAAWKLKYEKESFGGKKRFLLDTFFFFFEKKRRRRRRRKRNVLIIFPLQIVKSCSTNCGTTMIKKN
jgi:hypothetical protein